MPDKRNTVTSEGIVITPAILPIAITDKMAVGGRDNRRRVFLSTLVTVANVSRITVALGTSHSVRDSIEPDETFCSKPRYLVSSRTE